MDAVVIGAGIGGLTAALTLARAGVTVRVFEQAEALREVGAGIQIAPNATRILHRLGLAERLPAWRSGPSNRSCGPGTTGACCGPSPSAR